MCLTFKVHKATLSTRPIVSLSGTVLCGLEVWLDYKLQPLVKKIESHTSSSRHLLNDIFEEQPFGPNARVFTADAVGVCTNIDTHHALSVIKHFMQTHVICKDLDWEPIYHALVLCMKRNVFKFSDLHFLQKIGTAMGTPPAVTSAILYFAMKEFALTTFKNWLAFCRRCMDDVLVMWLLDTNKENDERMWTQFK